MMKDNQLAKRIAILAGANMQRSEIARAVGLAVDQLERDFEYELTVGAATCVEHIVGKLHYLALEGDEEALAILHELHERDPASCALPSQGSGH